MKTIAYFLMLCAAATLMAFVYFLLHNTIPAPVAICGGAINLIFTFRIARIIDKMEENEND